MEFMDVVASGWKPWDRRVDSVTRRFPIIEITLASSEIRFRVELPADFSFMFRGDTEYCVRANDGSYIFVGTYPLNAWKDPYSRWVVDVPLKIPGFRLPT